MTVICPSRKHSISRVRSDPPAFQYWDAPRIWDGATVYILGGGPSLKDMDFTMLHNKRTIGCNGNYRLGSAVVDCCYWGDWSFYVTHFKDYVRNPATGETWPGLRLFKGLIVTCNTKPALHKQTRVKVLQRIAGGIQKAPRIGWYENTGISAINLAVIFGAARIILLGFDMKLGKDGSANHYPNLTDVPNGNVYKKFMERARDCARQMSRKYPSIPIIDANPQGEMSIWPKMDREEALALS